MYRGGGGGGAGGAGGVFLGVVAFPNSGRDVVALHKITGVYLGKKTDKLFKYMRKASSILNICQKCWICSFLSGKIKRIENLALV